jgi:RimJ/RimL family protein N-acetyltransferase
MLEGKNVGLRQIEESDLPIFRDWRNSPYIRGYTREYRPLNMINQKRWFESLLTDSSDIMFAIEKRDSKEVIGCCGLTYINWKEGHGEDTERYLYTSANRNGKKRDTQPMHFNFYLNTDFVNCDYIEFMLSSLNIMSVA